MADAARRINVDITADSEILQAAVGKAAESLRKLGTTVTNVGLKMDAAAAQMVAATNRIATAYADLTRRVVADSAVQRAAIDSVTAAYMEQAAAARVAGGVGGAGALRAGAAAAAGGAAGGRGGPVLYGVRGPERAGSVYNPIVAVLEAGRFTPLGVLGASIGQEGTTGKATSTASSDPITAATIALQEMQRRGAGGNSSLSEAALTRVMANAITNAERNQASERVFVAGRGGGRGGNTTFAGSRGEMTVRIDAAQYAGLISSLADVAAASSKGGGGGNLPVAVTTGGGSSNGNNGALALLTTLLFGKGVSRTPIGGVPYAVGGLAGLAGLSGTHLATTGLALGSFAAGGAAGAGLLGLGAAGQIGVGGGSDLAVLKSTLSDTQSIYKAYQNLSTAVLQYGRNSTQAANAQAALNATLQGLGSGPGVAAENKLAQSVNNLNTQFDALTQNARVQAADIFEQMVGLANKFLPLVAKAADQNLSIINKDIKPLFTWLEGPQGIGIFNDLERRFKGNLPIAVHAFTQAMELLVKTIDDPQIQNALGGLTRAADRFFTRFNGSDFGRWHDEIGRLVHDFEDWKKFVEILAKDLYQVFHADAHTGQAIITDLTGMLTKLHEWLRSTGGQNAMHSVFEAHKQQIEALLSLIPALVKALGPVYLTTMPILMGMLTDLVKALSAFITAIDKLGPGARFVVGLTLLTTKLLGVKTVLSGITGLLSKIPGVSTALSKIGLGGASGGIMGIRGSAAAGSEANPIATYVVNGGVGGGPGGGTGGTAEEGGAGAGGGLTVGGAVGAVGEGSVLAGSIAIAAPLVVGAILAKTGAGGPLKNPPQSQGGGGRLGGLSGGGAGTGINSPTPANIDDWQKYNALVDQANQALQQFSSTGNATGLQTIIAKAQTLAQQWPQNSSQLQLLVDKMQAAETQVLPVLRNQMQQAAQQGGQAFTRMQTQVANALAQMSQQTVQQIGQIEQTMGQGTAKATDDAMNSLTTYVSNVDTAMSDGATATSKGMSLIISTTNKALKEMGQKTLSPIQVSSVTIGTAKQLAMAHAQATGGWVGGPGQKSGDQVPAMLGRGEAVLNWQQQRVVNTALAGTPYGSLGGVFNATAGSKHWMAGGGYVDPIPGYSLGRDDMGVDADAPPGTPIVALGDSKLVDVIPNWYKGQPLLDFLLMNGRDAGRYWYVAEQIAPVSETVGSMFKEGQIVARFARQGTGIEIGWAGNAAGSTLAQAQGAQWAANPAPGQTTPYGQSFLGIITGSPTSIVPGGPGGGGTISTPRVSGTGAFANVVKGAVQTAAAAANTLIGGKGGGVSTAGLSGSLVNIVRQIASRKGWGAAEVQAWLNVINAESGGSMTARNPSSGAYGIAQFISGAGEYAQYGGNANTLSGQLVAMANYISQRYGTPIGAWAHELSNHWYAGGHNPGNPKPSKGTTVHPAHVHIPKTPKPKLKIPKTGSKAAVKALTPKDLSELAQIGGQINPLWTQIQDDGTQLTSLSSRFQTVEGEPQFLNPDGSINAAGIAQKTQDDQALLAIQQQIYNDYVGLLGPVSSALTKFTGVGGSISKDITADQAKESANKAKLAANAVKVASLRKIILDLQKPQPPALAKLEAQLGNTRLNWEQQISAAQKQKQQFLDQTTARKQQLRGAVLRLEGANPSATARRLEDNVANAELALANYNGPSGATLQGLERDVTKALANYQLYLTQNPSGSGTPALRGARLAYSTYLNSIVGQERTLTDSVANLRSGERDALAPIERAIIAERLREALRKAKISKETHGLREQIAGIGIDDARLRKSDTALATAVTSLKADLTGSGGQLGNNQTMSLLETIAAQLGTVEFNSAGLFTGINTNNQGGAYDTMTAIIGLQNDIGTLGTDSGTVAAATTDNTALVQALEQQNLILSEEVTLGTAQTNALASMIPLIPSFDTGGPIMDDTLAQVHKGEYVVPKGGALVSGGGGGSGPTTLEFHQHLHGDMNGLAQFIDQRIRHPSNVLAVSKQIGRRTSMLKR